MRGRARLMDMVRGLHPGSFAFVMATGIVSIGADELGARPLAAPLLAVTVAGFAALCLMFLVRIWRYPADVWADTARPERAFGFFTVVAGCNVLGIGLLKAGIVGVADGLAVVAALVWVLLAYGILGRVVLAARKPEPEAAVNGTWLIWVVGTQSVSVAASTLGMGLGIEPRVVALVAVSLWAFGALLYLLLMGIVLARLVLAPLDPIQASPPYWISMGATAITVLAGADLLLLPKDLPSLAASRSTVEGLTLFLWAFGTWWFPFLIMLSVWRYRILSAPVYEPALWSMVFPLGMYAVATEALGRVASLPLLPGIARAEFWLALAAWAAVAAWMVISWVVPGWRARAEPSVSAVPGS
jgi:tellurite resistance protein TehA-like permease